MRALWQLYSKGNGDDAHEDPAQKSRVRMGMNPECMSKLIDRCHEMIPEQDCDAHSKKQVCYGEEQSNPYDSTF